jgi:multiple sugar transport system permease protein
MSLETVRAPEGALGRPGVSWQRRSEQVLGRDWRIAYLFALPMLALLLGLIAWPFVSAFYMSFYHVIGPRWVSFVGLQNYTDQWTDPLFLDSFGITIRFTVASVALKFVIGLCAALLLHNIRWGRAILAPLVLLPWILPEVATALVWRFLFDSNFGGLNAMLGSLYAVTGGLLGTDKGVPWIGTAEWALASMILVNVWKGVPFFTLLALAGLKAIDGELYDAAAVDGANAWQRFLHITLPGLRYVIIVETLLSTIGTFNAFGLIYLITGGGPAGATRVYAVLAYEKIGGLRYAQGVAIALTMAPLLLLAIFILGRYMRAGQRGDFGAESLAWRILMAVLWPVRLLLKAVVRLFWLVDEAIEGVFRVIGRRVDAALARRGPEAQARATKTSRRAGGIFMWAGLIAIILFELFPFYWVIATAFKTPEQIRTRESIYWPQPWTLFNVDELLTQTNFLAWMGNTVQVAIVSTLIGVTVSALGAYALVRLRWRGAGFLSSAILLVYLMPGIMMVVPLFQLFATLRLSNSLAALMIAYPTFLMPFACWLLMGYYRSIPEELEDAALIDGANRFQAFYMIVLPLVTPAIIAVAIFAITQAWNEFLFAFVFISRDSATTLPVGLGRMVIGDVFPWGRLMAAALLMALPVVVFYSLAQRFLVEGLTAGSVKG